MIPVIISGGSGSRLWPVSRQSDPKPFIKLSDGVSLLQNTFIRAAKLNNVKTILTITNEKLYFRMQDEYQEINHNNVVCDFILEPFGKNTAPAIAAACMFVRKYYGEDETILILPADHLISNIDAFITAAQEAENISNKGFLTTFGIKPEYPETGYGYIEADDKHVLNQGYKVKRFVEKPDLAHAQEYIDSNNYLWNSGMFCGCVKTFITEFETYSPLLFATINTCFEYSRNDNFNCSKTLHLSSEYFLQVEDISIDYALFEKSTKTAVIPCSIGWSDIGSWLSIAQTIPKDSQNNAIIGENILHNTRDCLIYSTDRIVASVDVQNLIIVDTADAVLVADKNNSQNVKLIFERLRKMEHKASDLHQTVYRPWGIYTVLEEGPFYKIKKIEVKPNSRLSLQLHHHRSEHWIVVDGIATITIGDRIFELDANKSTYIPAQTQHRLENNTDKNLTLIEVQCGQYLGEDDIIRFEDQYNRT